MKAIYAFLKAISTEDPENQIFDPVRVIWLAGGIIGLVGGFMLCVAGFHAVWFLKTVPSFTDMGTGLGLWLGGFGAYVVGGAGALWAKAKADDVGGTVVEKTEVTKPPAETTTVKKTTTTKDK